MGKEELFNSSADEANLKLNEKMNDDNNSPNSKKEGSSVTETNLKIQDAFYGENQQEDDVVPTYVTNETAAVKITGAKK